MRYIVGIDEVGRGPLAGPVTVCAALFPSRFSFKKASQKLGVPLRDSKRLTETQRIQWAEYLKKEKGILYGLSTVSPRHIDRINIKNATNKAVESALGALLKKKRIPKHGIHIYMDGGLAISPKATKKLGLRHMPRSILHGDATIPQIAAASILAKVSRDRLMTRLALRYPHYGFEHHKGYGTKKHYQALRRYGISPIHRRSFLRAV